MIYLFTDYGHQGPYLGLLEAALRREAPDLPVIHLMADAPAMDPEKSSYLLAALETELAPGATILAVVDPGVGGPRAPIMVEAGGRCFVGPDNGLLDGVAANHPSARWYEILWRPERLSPTFHGRDLFAPVAARLAKGRDPGPRLPLERGGRVNRPKDCPEILYVDGFGNAITGLTDRAEFRGRRLRVLGTSLKEATTFSEVPPGTLFWYRNSIGLVEIAAHGTPVAAQLAGVGVGTPVSFEDPF